MARYNFETAEMLEWAEKARNGSPYAKRRYDIEVLRASGHVDAAEAALADLRREEDERDAAN